MSDRVRVDWYVPTAEWEQFREYVESEYGEIEGYLGRETERAMQQYVDTDGYGSVEERVNRLVRAAGRRPDDLDEEKNLSSDLDRSETTRAYASVESEVKDEFREAVKDESDPYGVILAKAVREYRGGGRAGRLERKLDRVLDDAEALLATASEDTDTGLRKNGREVKTVAICNQLDEQFTDKELVGTIQDTAGVSSAPSVRQYREEVVERLDVEPHPANSDLWVPREVVDDLLGEGVPRECRMPVEYLDREQREERVMLELGRRAIPRDGNDSVSATDVRTDLLDDVPARSTVADILGAVARTDGYTVHETGDTARLRVDLNTVNAYNPELMGRIRAYYDEGSTRDASLTSYNESEDSGDETDDIAAEWDALDSASPDAAFATDGGPDDLEDSD
ncbi:hypothetical protein ACFPYI_20980 [Halomarina salina]|uniref:Uncharacterized protein n=1 Tax=Halomarina salina TaxID=1872699 RepID=A0ABD5RTP8_9EURY|nr:hypothetical protein [Halomarina salina]